EIAYISSHEADYSRRHKSGPSGSKDPPEVAAYSSKVLQKTSEIKQKVEGQYITYQKKSAEETTKLSQTSSQKSAEENQIQDETKKEIKARHHRSRSRNR
ncbi:unnamed protein product, partial [Meganyctiphanes norvegica]